jgi:hypothetical protein
MTMRLPALHKLTARLAVLAALLACVVCAGGAFATSASAAEAGVNLNTLEPSGVAQVKALGAHWVRVFAPWPDLEPSPGVHSAFWFPRFERAFSSLPKGTKVIVDFVGAPSWETGTPTPNAPPANPGDYAGALHYVAQRWAGHVAAYEIWNEENLSSWWAGAPDPAAYTSLLQAAYPAVKSADPTAKVVLGGLAGNDYNYLEGIYKAGGKGDFDAIGVHNDTACNVNSPYSVLRDSDERLDPDSFLGYREVHATELANGDHKPIWMTEMSWRTTSAECSEGVFSGMKPEGVSETRQASYLSDAYHCLAQNSYVQVGLWFPIIDEPAVESGLLHTNSTRKPAYLAMRSYIRHGDRVKGTCGDFAGPRITVETPSRDHRYTGHLWIRVKASDSQGIATIRLLDDGHSIRNFDPFVEGRGYPHTVFAQIHWSGARHISFGRHTLTILAYDKLKNVSRSYVSIVHLPEHAAHH